VFGGAKDIAKVEVCIPASGAIASLEYYICKGSSVPTVTPAPPTKTPSFEPTIAPTLTPNSSPTLTPTKDPSVAPTKTPSIEPTAITSPPTVTPTKDPSDAPSMTPTKSPSIEPTVRTPTPTVTPTEDPSIAPTVTPTESPTPAPTSCPYIVCDFSNLLPNVYLSDGMQAAKLFDACGLTVSAKKGDTVGRVNVFNSSDIKGPESKFDPDLGSPNENCPGGGPGIGEGGGPDALFPNCAPLGNVLVIQDPRSNQDTANDSGLGGCITFEFSSPIEMVNTGILDSEEDGVSVKVGFNTAHRILFANTTKKAALTHICDISRSLFVYQLIGEMNNVVGPFIVPPVIGDNGFWPVNATTEGFSGAQPIVKMEIW
jgi:hypothetical protein